MSARGRGPSVCEADIEPPESITHMNLSQSAPPFLVKLAAGPLNVFEVFRYPDDDRARWSRSPLPRSSSTDRQQAMLQRFVRLEFGALAAEDNASPVEHHGIPGERQGQLGFLLRQEHRDPGFVADRRQRGEQ